MNSTVGARIRAAWLEQGCFNLDGLADQERFTQTIRNRLEQLTGRKLGIALWPGGPNFKHTTWWHEEATPPQSVASFFATVKGGRGCGLFAGVRVEKGLEDENAAIGREDHLMKRAWDWSNFLKRLDKLPKLLREAQAALGGQKLYFWLEFHHEDYRYYRLQDGVAYEQGGERASAWNELVELLKRHRPDVWVDISIVRPFGLADWHDHDLLVVFESLAPIYQLWRGI
jgi:hypothetical protein